MVVMGQVSAPYGIRGWIKVTSFTETVESLLDFPVWWIGREGGWRETRVIEAHVHGKGIVANIEASPDRNAAESMKGWQVAVPRSSLPVSGEDEYYWSDLIGLRVLNLDGIELGVVEGLIETGANDVLEVKGKEGHFLIPFVSGYIHEVDMEKRMIRAEWGLDY